VLVLDRPSVNIVALLGAIIGIGVVAKNGILMLDSVHRFESQGVTLENALVESGRRRWGFCPWLTASAPDRTCLNRWLLR